MLDARLPGRDAGGEARSAGPGRSSTSSAASARAASEFTLRKLRTMRVDAEAEGRAEWSGDDDPRQTRVGTYLRQTHIDELPQLWNVVKRRDVGGRPAAASGASSFRSSSTQLPFYDRRLMVKPGLTGWAQVSCGYAGSKAGTAWKLSFDLYYLKHRSRDPRPADRGRDDRRAAARPAPAAGCAATGRWSCRAICATPRRRRLPDAAPTRSAPSPRLGAEAVADPAHASRASPGRASCAGSRRRRRRRWSRGRSRSPRPEPAAARGSSTWFGCWRKVRRSSNSRALSSTVSPPTLAQRVRRSSATSPTRSCVSSAAGSPPRSWTRIRATSSSK